MYFIHVSNGKFVTYVYDERIAPVDVLIIYVKFCFIVAIFDLVHDVEAINSL